MQQKKKKIKEMNTEQTFIEWKKMFAEYATNNRGRISRIYKGN